jgi:uncharacterized protein YllA (UPF0747 family)
LALDANLERPLKKTSEQMRRALQAYRSKVTAAVARRDDTNRSRLEALRGNCLPQGQLQERVIASAHFPGKYGDRFVEALLQQTRLDSEYLHIVTP